MGRSGRLTLLLALPSQMVYDSATGLSGQVVQLQNRLSPLPFVGSDLSGATGQLAPPLLSIQDQAREQIAAIRQGALVTGLITFFIPAVLYALSWLPGRLRFARERSAIKKALQSGNTQDLDFLLASRALAAMTYQGALEGSFAASYLEGNYRTLAHLELQRFGLSRNIR